MQATFAARRVATAGTAPLPPMSLTFEELRRACGRRARRTRLAESARRARQSIDFF